MKRLDLAKWSYAKASGIDDIADSAGWSRPNRARSPAQNNSWRTRRTFAREKRITPLGRRMLAFPVHPRYARMLLAAEEPAACARSP